MPHLHRVFFHNGSYKFQHLWPQRYLDWKAKAEIKWVFKQNVKYDWWVWQEERYPCGGQQWWQEARMKKKKALHQVLSKATVFTSFDLFLAELPFPVICTKYLGPDTWSVSVNSTNGGKHKTRQCLTQKYRPEETGDSSTRGFPAKWRLRNKRGNSILMTRHYPDPGCASDWSCLKESLIRPIRSTTQIWVITRHQYW